MADRANHPEQLQTWERKTYEEERALQEKRNKFLLLLLLLLSPYQKSKTGERPRAITIASARAVDEAIRHALSLLLLRRQVCLSPIVSSPSLSLSPPTQNGGFGFFPEKIAVPGKTFRCWKEEL